MGQTKLGTCQDAPYWLSEVMDPLGWSKPIDGDEAGSVLTSGYKSTTGYPIAVTLSVSFNLVRYLVNADHTHERSTTRKMKQNSRSKEAYYDGLQSHTQVIPTWRRRRRRQRGTESTSFVLCSAGGNDCNSETSMYVT